jgi:hypothetical protein
MRRNWAGVVLLLGFAMACGQDPVEPSHEPALTASTAASNWTSEASMTVMRQRAKAATVNGVVYVIGGGSRLVEGYNVAARTWTTKRPLPEVLTPTGATTINGKIYVAGGFYGSQISKTLYVYNPATDAWTRKADLPYAIAQTTGHQGAISGKLYVYAGVTINPDGSRGQHRFFRYNPATNSWATLHPPPYARSGGASGATDGSFYLIGGRLPTSRNGVGYAYDVHSYTPGTGWTKTPLGNHGLNSGLAYATLGKKLYIVGLGYEGDGCSFNSSAIYDPASHTLLRFSPQAPLRSGAIGAAAAGKFFVMGGADYPPLDGSPDETCGSPVSWTTEVLAYTP